MGHINSCVRTVFVGLALAGLAGVTVAQTAGKADDSRIQKLVGDLGDKSLKVREDATKELAAIGPDARPALTKAAASSDPEVAQRAKTILSQIAKACFEAASKEMPKNISWSCPIKDGITGRIVIEDGVAYVVSLDHALHAVDIKSGKEKWSQGQLSQELAVVLSQVAVWDKAAMAMLQNGDVTGLDIATGKVIWKYKHDDAAASTQPAAGQPAPNPAQLPAAGGGTVMGGRLTGSRERSLPVVGGWGLYVPQEDGVVVLNTETGKKLQEIKPVSPPMGTPAVGGCRLVMQLCDGSVRGYSFSDGSEQWKHPGGMSATAIVCNGREVYFIGDPMTMYALDSKTGKEVWQCPLPAVETGAAEHGAIGAHLAGIPGVPAIAPRTISARDQSLAIKGGTLYTLQGSSLIAVNAVNGKLKWQRRIDVWRDEAPDSLKRDMLIARSRLARGFDPTVSPFVIDGNIAYVNAGQLGVYAVGLDDGSAQWALRTNMPVGDMVLLDGVLYFGTSRQGVFNARPLPMLMVQEGVATDPAKPDAQSKDVLPEGLHALKVK